MSSCPSESKILSPVLVQIAPTFLLDGASLRADDPPIVLDCKMNPWSELDNKSSGWEHVDRRTSFEDNLGSGKSLMEQ